MIVLKDILKDKEFFLVQFPIVFPLLYAVILFNFPTLETILIFMTILLLAEPHFGATWPFFINNANFAYIKQNKVSLIVVPVLIIIFSFLGFFFFNKIFYLIFFAVNMYHVTRQSFGISKLYSLDKKDIRFQETFIYIFNGLFFLIAYLRFFLNLDFSNYIIILNLGILAFLFLTILIYIYLYGINQNLFTYITGSMIFYPACFVENPVHVILMGVTMHFSQYLYLTNKIVIGREKLAKINSPKPTYSKNFLLTIIIYGILMALLSMFGKYEANSLKNFIIIPIIGQMLHFYLDSQLWKFSVKHNRENVLKFL